jgi:hypothetical protein
MAGALAQLYFFGEVSDGHDGPGSDAEAICYYTDGDEELQRALWSHCADLVEQYAPIIDFVACILLEKGRLSGPAVDKLVAVLR